MSYLVKYRHVYTHFKQNDRFFFYAFLLLTIFALLFLSVLHYGTRYCVFLSISSCINLLFCVAVLMKGKTKLQARVYNVLYLKPRSLRGDLLCNFNAVCSLAFILLFLSILNSCKKKEGERN